MRENRAGRGGGRAPARAAAGFTLLEVVVAALILAVGLSITFELISLSLRGAAAVTVAGHALDVAREKLDELFLVGELREGSAEGETPEGFRWTRQVRLAKTREIKAGGRTAVLYELRVRVTAASGRERPVELVTLRALPKN